MNPARRRRMTRHTPLGGLCVGLALLASLSASTPQSRATTPGAARSVTFSDVTKQSGLTFRHTNGAFGKKYLPETMGSGGAFLDYDEDGWQDVFLVNSTNWPGRPAIKAT